MFRKGLLFPKTWHRVNHCWNYGPSNLLFRFFRYRLSHLTNRQTDKNSRKLDNTFFWKLTPKQLLGESFKFFDPPTTKWYTFKLFAKLNGNHIVMANFSKFYNYQTFGLIVLHNLSKGQLGDRILKLWKWLCLRLPGRRTYNFWNSDFLIFPIFKRFSNFFSRFQNKLWKYW